MPRAIRTLLFGSTHYEIDLIGSHYQLFQKFALSLLQIPLPSIQDLRSLLRTDMEVPPCRVLELSPTAVKDLPTFLLNTTLDTILLHYRNLGYWPSTPIYNILPLFALSPVFFRPLMIVLVLDAPPTLHMPTMVSIRWNILKHSGLKSSHPISANITPSSVLFGYMTASGSLLGPPLEAIAAANRHASAHIGLPSSPLEFRITSCRPSYIDVLTPLLRGAPLPLDTPSPLTPPRPYTSPPFAEQLARESFTRMMRRTAPSSSLIVIDD